MFSATSPYYADFTTGQTVNYLEPKLTDELAALAAYHKVAAQYQDLYLPSYAKWPAAKDIPEDLLMPFGEFATKYKLNDTMLVSFRTPSSGPLLSS